MRTAVLLIVCGSLLCLTAGDALAIPNFKKQFEAKYADKEGTDAQKAVSKAMGAGTKGCLVCHMGKSKKMRNPYGMALSELLDKKEDKDNMEKIDEALEKVAKMKVDPNKSDSETFGDRLKAGKLPVEMEAASQ